MRDRHVEDDSDGADDGVPERNSEARTSAERAHDTIRAIQAGADPVAEALTLSNRFTDDATSRLKRWFRGLFGRR